MSRPVTLNFRRHIFLEKEELNRFKESMVNKNYDLLSFSLLKKYGIYDFQLDPNKLNFKVTTSSAGTIDINGVSIGGLSGSYAINASQQILHRLPTTLIPIPNDNDWYWIRITRAIAREEEGTISVGLNGLVTGVGTQFTAVCRGNESGFPTYIRFRNVGVTGGSTHSTINDGLFEVANVIDDETMYVQGVTAVETSGDSLLKYAVHGSIELGYKSEFTNSNLYEYAGCSIGIVPEVDNNTAPTDGFIQDEKFYLARVKNSGGTITIQDKRTDYVSILDYVYTTPTTYTAPPDSGWELLTSSSSGLSNYWKYVLAEGQHIIKIDPVVSPVANEDVDVSLGHRPVLINIQPPNNVFDGYELIVMVDCRYDSVSETQGKMFGIGSYNIVNGVDTFVGNIRNNRLQYEVIVGDGGVYYLTTETMKIASPNIGEISGLSNYASTSLCIKYHWLDEEQQWIPVSVSQPFCAPLDFSSIDISSI